MQKIILLSIIFLSSCSTLKDNGPKSEVNTNPSREFKSSEVILTQTYLEKIYEKQTSLPTCIEDTEDAGLLLRTLGPRLEIAQDDFEAILDKDSDINQVIKTCELDCTCHYFDELLREHQVTLSKESKKILESKKSGKEKKRCLESIQKDFCNSEIYKTLNLEKSDFSFDE